MRNVLISQENNASEQKDPIKTVACMYRCLMTLPLTSSRQSARWKILTRFRVVRIQVDSRLMENTLTQWRRIHRLSHKSFQESKWILTTFCKILPLNLLSSTPTCNRFPMLGIQGRVYLIKQVEWSRITFLYSKDECQCHQWLLTSG